jgi:4-hydroxy-tetrahydrodipicolinate reductase
MVNIMMHGCNGKMGQVISEIVKNDIQAQIIPGKRMWMPEL